MILDISTYALFIEHIPFELENSVFLDRKTIFSFVFCVIFVTYAVDYSLPSHDSIVTPCSIEMSIFTTKSHQTFLTTESVTSFH